MMPNDKDILTKLSTQNLTTVGDILMCSPAILVILADRNLIEVHDLIERISKSLSPPAYTALDLLLKKRAQTEADKFLSTGLRSLDAALQGGLPMGCISEICG